MLLYNKQEFRSEKLHCLTYEIKELLQMLYPTLKMMVLSMYAQSLSRDICSLMISEIL